MDVPALANGLDGFTNFSAILDDRLVLGQVAHGDFMTQRHFVAQGNFARRLALEGHDADGSPFLQISDGDAYVVIVLMQQNTMFHILSNRE